MVMNIGMGASKQIFKKHETFPVMSMFCMTRVLAPHRILVYSTARPHAHLAISQGLMYGLCGKYGKSVATSGCIQKHRLHC